MSKKTYIDRYLWMIRTIENHPYITFGELQDRFYQTHPDIREQHFAKRTFHRDQLEITELLGIEIKYNKAQKGYYIDHETEGIYYTRLLELYELTRTLHHFNGLPQLLQTEKRHSGIENLSVLIEAIKNRYCLAFTYHKYSDQSITSRMVKPYFLKEFKYRWYVVALDTGDNKVKTFALERISSPEILPQLFDMPANIHPETYFDDCFGIFRLEKEQPETIILSFAPLKGNFIKSVPLHTSQQIITDNADELRIQLKVFLSHDFLIEILSHGDEIKIIAPKRLKNMVIATMKRTLSGYEE